MTRVFPRDSTPLIIDGIPTSPQDALSQILKTGKLVGNSEENTHSISTSPPRKRRERMAEVKVPPPKRLNISKASNKERKTAREILTRPSPKLSSQTTESASKVTSETIKSAPKVTKSTEESKIHHSTPAELAKPVPPLETRTFNFERESYSILPASTTGLSTIDNLNEVTPRPLESGPFAISDLIPSGVEKRHSEKKIKEDKSDSTGREIGTKPNSPVLTTSSPPVKENVEKKIVPESSEKPSSPSRQFLNEEEINARRRRRPVASPEPETRVIARKDKATSTNQLPSSLSYPSTIPLSSTVMTDDETIGKVNPNQVYQMQLVIDPSTGKSRPMLVPRIEKTQEHQFLVPMRNYSSMSSEAQEMWRTKFDQAFAQLRLDFPHWKIPVYGPETSLESLHAIYYTRLKYIKSRYSIGRTKMAISVLTFFIELAVTHYFKINIESFTQTQQKMFERYEQYFFNGLEDESFDGLEKQSPIMQIILLSAANLILIGGANLIRSKLNPGISFDSTIATLQSYLIGEIPQNGTTIENLAPKQQVEEVPSPTQNVGTSIPNSSTPMQQQEPGFNIIDALGGGGGSDGNVNLGNLLSNGAQMLGQFMNNFQGNNNTASTRSTTTSQTQSNTKPASSPVIPIDPALRAPVRRRGFV